MPPAMVELARAVPGAPPTNGKSANKKKKQQQASTTNGARNDSHHAQSQEATATTLMERVPSHDRVDERIKEHAADLADEAERNGAIAAVAIVEEKEAEKAGTGDDRDHKSAMQLILAKRIKVLSKKLQRAVAYEALEEGKLNTDMKRIIASKPALEAGVAELTEATKALETAEKDASKQMEKQTRQAFESKRRELEALHEKRTATLCQFLYLHSLILPSSAPSFTPAPLPPTLEQATGQEVAAVAKLFAELSSSTEVVPQDAKSTLISNIASGSTADVLEGVSYQCILGLVESLSAPALKQSAGPHEGETTAIPNGVQPHDSTPGGILFMQKSEIEEIKCTSVKANDDVTQEEESKGGARDEVQSKEVNVGAIQPDEEGTKGDSSGEHVSQVHAEEVGSAQALKPVQSTEGVQTDEGQGPAKTAAQLLHPGPKVIDWANDDDDWGDMLLQPAPSATPSALATPTESVAALAPAAKSNGADNGATPQQKNGAEQHKSTARPPRERTPAHRFNKQQYPQHQQQDEATPMASSKSMSEVDEDGFTVVRSKVLQQQQQSAHRGASRGGGRGTGSGRGGRGGFYDGDRRDAGYKGPTGGRGGGQGRGGSAFVDGRGRGRGRGSRPTAEHAG